MIARRSVLAGAVAAGGVLAGGALVGPGLAGARPRRGGDSEIWTFDSLTRIGGMAPVIEGAPRRIDSPWGGAIAFDGVDDRLALPRHPLAGAARFTFEALFRPDGGASEQRWFHLESGTEADALVRAGQRMLFEIRVAGEQWWLDAFLFGPGYRAPLIDPAKRWPVGRWHHVAQSYDGRVYRAFVNGVEQARAELAFVPQAPGVASVGMRMNRVSPFNGAVRAAAFTRGAALAPEAYRLPLPEMSGRDPR